MAPTHILIVPRKHIRTTLDLTTAEMQDVMRLIMTGQATPAQIGGFLVGLRLKGESVEEIAAAAGVMRELATPVGVSGPHLVDTCGTGGDGASPFAGGMLAPWCEAETAEPVIGRLGQLRA